MKKKLNIKFFVNYLFLFLLVILISFLLYKYQKKIYHHHYYVYENKSLPEQVAKDLNFTLEAEMKKNDIFIKVLLMKKNKILNDKILLTGKDGYFYRVIDEDNLKIFEKELKQSDIIEKTKKKLINTYYEKQIDYLKTIEFGKNILSLENTDISNFFAHIHNMRLYERSLKSQLGNYDTIRLDYKKVQMKNKFSYYFDAIFGIYILVLALDIGFRKILKLKKNNFFKN